VISSAKGGEAERGGSLAGAGMGEDEDEEEEEEGEDEEEEDVEGEDEEESDGKWEGKSMDASATSISASSRSENMAAVLHCDSACSYSSSMSMLHAPSAVCIPFKCQSRRRE
jgi:hypothetical protein